jgi:hypothetical protein
VITFGPFVAPNCFEDPFRCSLNDQWPSLDRGMNAVGTQPPFAVAGLGEMSPV